MHRCQPANLRIIRERVGSTNKRRRRGAAAVEFALVAPVLFLLLFGVVEFGRIVMLRQALTNAAREGAREATLITTTSSTSADAAVRRYLQGVITGADDPAKVSVAVKDGADVTVSDLTATASGSLINVEVAVNLLDVSWLPPSLLHSEALVLRGTATQRRE